VNASDPRFTGGFGVFRHSSDPFTPDNTDIVTPDNTPCSWGWFDLRAEPVVTTVPAIDRCYILPFHDLHTTYAGYVSAATTGTGAGRYMLAGERSLEGSARPCRSLGEPADHRTLVMSPSSQPRPK
jgi:hypothetical protein